MDRNVPVTIMNHRLIMLDDDVHARRRKRVKRFWARPCLSADRRLYDYGRPGLVDAGAG